MNTLDQVMNTGDVAANPMQGFTETVLHLTETVQDAARLLTDEARKLAAHERLMGTAQDPGHVKLGIGFERLPDGTVNINGTADFERAVAALREWMEAELAAIHAELFAIRTELAEAKEPKPHAATHAANGTDPVTPATLGLNTSVEPKPGTIPLRDAEGNVQGHITGNSTYA